MSNQQGNMCDPYVMGFRAAVHAFRDKLIDGVFTWKTHQMLCIIFVIHIATLPDLPATLNKQWSMRILPL